MKRELVIAIIIVLLLLCSCNNTASESISSPRTISSGAAINIETIPNVTSEATSEESIYFEVNSPTYSVMSCDFVFNSVDHTVVARYDDTNINPEGYIIDFDFTYYDYGVNEVFIYEASEPSNYNQRVIELADTDWEETRDVAMGAIPTYTNNEFRLESSVLAALSYENSLIEDSNISMFVDLLRPYYDIHPNYCEYTYPICEMNSNEEPDYMYPTINDSNLLHLITIRSNLGGLPVGVPKDNEGIQSRLRYGEYYGSIFGIYDDYISGFIWDSEDIKVDFRYYDYNLQLVEGSASEVVPLEQCIENAIPGILWVSEIAGTNYCQVYTAELVYIPFSVGCTGLGDFDFDIYYVPVWAIYVIAVGNSAIASPVYLNAMTGELFSNGL